MESVVDSARHFHFPNDAWWKARTIPDHVPQYRITRRPSAAAEYGTSAGPVVKRMVGRIVERFSPVAVWLFGSMSRGDCNIHSDVDLMVVMPEGTDRRAATRDIMAAVRGSMLPYDIVVSTPGHWDSLVNDIGSLPYAVNRHGVMLYG